MCFLMEEESCNIAKGIVSEFDQTSKSSYHIAGNTGDRGTQ